MNVFNSLPKKTRKVLEEIGDCWRLEDGRRHIRIFVHDTMAGILPKKCRGDGDSTGRAEMNVISQIRRAARGDMSSRRMTLADL